MLEDEIIISPTEDSFSNESFVSKVINVPYDLYENVVVLLEQSFKSPPDSSYFSIKLKRKITSFNQMKEALCCVSNGSRFISPFFISLLLGHKTEDEKIPYQIFKRVSVPNLPDWDESQAVAIKTALERTITLIQSPPGTGKMTTAASIAYLLCKTQHRKLLVIAPSNAAVDRLCEKISQTGIKVISVSSRFDNDVSPRVSNLSLSKQQKQLSQRSYSSNANQQTIETQALQHVDAVCCTCLTARHEDLKDVDFESVIIIDSTQVIEPECLIALTTGCNHIVMFGDQCQLGPSIQCKQAAESGLGQSLFERFLQLEVPSVRLQMQHRMHWGLWNFSSRVFYGNSLENCSYSKCCDKTIEFPWPNPYRPMFFYCQSSQEEVTQDGLSFMNRIEALTVKKIVARMLEMGVEPNSIGVIVSYLGQQCILKKYAQLEKVQITTWDALEDGSKDYIIFCCVRANKIHDIGVLNEPRRLNVLLTRANRGFIIVGEPTTFYQDPLWNYLLHFYSEHNTLVQGELDNLVPYQLQSPKPSTPYTYEPESFFGLYKKTVE